MRRTLMTTLAAVLALATCSRAQSVVRGPGLLALTPESYYGYLRVPQLRGGVARPGYEGWFHVHASYLAVANPAGNAPRLSDLVVSLDLRAVSELSYVAAKGLILDEVEVVLFRQGGKDWRVRMRAGKAVVLRVATRASDQGGGLFVGFAYESIRWDVRDPVSGGRTTGEWDRGKSGGGLLPSALPAALPQSQQTFDAFLQLPGLKGDATEKGHEGWFRAGRVAQELIGEVPVGGTHEGAGEVLGDLGRLGFDGLPLLSVLALRGQELGGDVLLHIVRQGAAGWTLQIRLMGVRVSGVGSVANHGEGGQNVELEFRRIEWTYRDATGKTSTRWWDRDRNLGG